MFLPNSLGVGLLYSSMLWYLWVFFLICYYPSFCCVKRQSVSTYASLLAKSLIFKEATFIQTSWMGGYGELGWRGLHVAVVSLGRRGGKAVLAGGMGSPTFMCGG